MQIERFNEYSFQIESAQIFFESLDSLIKESDESSIKEIAKKVLSELNLNVSLALTFGSGIGACYPIVEKLMKNMGIESFILSQESIVLLTITSLTILYLEEKKANSANEEAELTSDAKSMLEELKMNGIGNGIVKKVIKALKSVKNIFSIIGKHIGAMVGGVIDMFSYTAILIPIMNGVMAIIDKYDLNLDTLSQNFMGLAAGIATIIAKHGIVEVLKRLKNKFKINKQAVIDDLDTPVIQKFATFGDADKEQQSGDLIKEQ